MKKVIYILFVLLYTVITLGFTVNKHYSGDELFAIAIYSEPESCCADVCDCCNEESETVQFLVDYTFSIDNFEPTPGELELFTALFTIDIQEPNFSLTKSEVYEQDLPPPNNTFTLSLFQTYLL